MGVGLPDDDVASTGFVSALIPGDDARRDAGGPHQEDEGGGVVFAEAAPRLEEELVDRIVAEQRRLQCIDEGFAAEELQRFRCDGIRRRVLASPAVGEGAGRSLPWRGRRRAALSICLDSSRPKRKSGRN